MEEAYNRAAIAVAGAVLPSRIFANPCVKSLLQCLGELQSISSKKTLELCLERMSSKYKMAKRVETLHERYIMVKYI